VPRDFSDRWRHWRVDCAMSLDTTNRGLKSEINITPLVDVVLVLLIIFMVVTPLMTRGKPLQLPESTAARPAAQGEPLLVSVSADGDAHVGSALPPASDPRLTLEITRAAKDLRRVVLRADANTEYRSVRRVLALAAVSHVAVALSARGPGRNQSR
jgi:biopolymer transport protein ExbD